MSNCVCGHMPFLVSNARHLGRRLLRVERRWLHFINTSLTTLGSSLNILFEYLFVFFKQKTCLAISFNLTISIGGSVHIFAGRVRGNSLQRLHHALEQSQCCYRVLLAHFLMFSAIAKLIASNAFLQQLCYLYFRGFKCFHHVTHELT